MGRYVLKDVLGRGGFGEVWKAWDEGISRWVALKFLRADDERDLARFRREAKTAAALEHPGIVPVFEIGDFDGRPFIAMEFVEGETLDRKGVSPRKAAAAIREAALALEFAHERGVIHRDLKPPNLMMDKAGRVRVMDFGLARHVEGGASLTGSGMMVGTPAYMSPEQARGERADVRTDVYGLGATLYALLAGRAPFEGGDVLSVAMRVIEEDPVPPRRLRPDVDAGLDAVVLKCLEKDPGRRYATAAELAEELGRYVAGESVRARRTFGRGFLRWRRLAVAIVGVLAVAIVAWAAITWRTSATAQATTDARRSLIDTLRQTSATCLQGALDMRRAGKPDAMESWAQKVEEACRAVMADQPALAEPHYLLGRMRRAQMRDAEALPLQDEALRREPSFAPALYERIVLRGRGYRALLETLRRDDVRSRTGAGRVTRAPVQTTDAALKAMPQALAAKNAIKADLDAVRARAGAIGEAQLLVVSGIEAWMRGDNATAEEHFHRAGERDARLEEATEWAADVYSEDNIFSQAVLALSAGIRNDAGYVPFRESRAMANLYHGMHEAVDPAVRETALRDALADANEAVRMAPARGSARFTRAIIRVGRGNAAERDGGREEYLEAIADYSAAIDLGSDRQECLVERGGARVNLAHAEVESGRDAQATYDAAIADFDAAIREGSESHRAWSFRGNANVGMARMQIRTGRDASATLKEALRNFDDALKRNPRAWDTWLAPAAAGRSQGFF